MNRLILNAHDCDDCYAQDPSLGTWLSRHSTSCEYWPQWPVPCHRRYPVSLRYSFVCGFWCPVFRQYYALLHLGFRRYKQSRDWRVILRINELFWWCQVVFYSMQMYTKNILRFNIFRFGRRLNISFLMAEVVILKQYFHCF